MIRFGLSGWNNHDALYPPLTKDKLSAYCVHFPIVELDSAFYAVQPARNYEKWARVTPEEFSFVVKAYQGMTGHLRGGHPFESAAAMFEAFLGSIPTVLHPTSKRLTLVRFHGRNVQGWNKTGGEEEWREVRYLYRYSREELLEWKERIERLQAETEEICVIFNNNSGRDAGPNAKELMGLLGVEYEGKVSGQLNLFDQL